MIKTTFSILTLALLILANLFFWSYMNRPDSLQSWNGPMMGVTFNPNREHHNPEKGLHPTKDEIDQDLSLLSEQVHAVRTYSMLNGLGEVPELAAEYNLNVTMGAWVGSDPIMAQIEIKNLIKVSRKDYPNIVRTLVGNEALTRKDIPVEQLITYLRQVRKQTWRPVSTSETWDIWIAHPELAKEVDFIAAHILPYWEKIPANEALDYVFDRYQALKQAFPDKPIIITEVGWPSDGQ
ncbi:MAG: beta-(1-3)-glucosyl transferase, partial [Cocleimonas sp.]